MVVPLLNAAADACGTKAATLGTLQRAGWPVPDGFVIPFDAYRAVVDGVNVTSFNDEPNETDAVRRAIETRSLPPSLLDAIGCGLDKLDNRSVAVRSSASSEDTASASAAGQHESVLAVQGVDEVVAAVRACWISLHSLRAIDYRRGTGRPWASTDEAMAVLVQRLVDAEVSGIMFTATSPGGSTEIEASWGLGTSIVGGTITPDAYRVAEDGPVSLTIGEKRTRLDRHANRLAARDVPGPMRIRPALDEATVMRLAKYGTEIAALLGGPQDIEWAIAEERIWILQARPITAVPPGRAPSLVPATPPATLNGVPGSHGSATGTARIVRGPRDFFRVRRGDILICPCTDPAWTPLLRIVAGVVTETGGILSHAAIVAREHRIPAVLCAPNATRRIHDGTTITVDGTAGTITRKYA